VYVSALEQNMLDNSILPSKHKPYPIEVKTKFMKEYNNPLLFSPGPTEISKESLKALSQPPIHHRTDEFEATLKEAFENLKMFFQTKNHVFILNATGTGAMEACIVNLLNAEDHVLAFDAGKFGERWAEMAKTFGCNTEIIKQDWGKPFNFELFEKKLSEKKYKAFLVHACETSTATKYPIKEISQKLKKIQPECLLLVDGITAVGCMDLPMDEYQIDGLVAGSQNSLGLMTGLSFISFSEKAWAHTKNAKMPRYYFDLVKEKKMNDKYSTHFSSPVNMIYALADKLERIKALGIQNFIGNSKKWQLQTQKFLEKLGCVYFSESPSESLSAFYLPQNVNVKKLQDELLKNGLYLAGGQDHLKDKILRWGHMGDITEESQQKAMAIFEKTLKEFKS
jgi:serine---pyruvate transaminase